MVEEELMLESVTTYETVPEEQCFFTVSACGKAIVDSGATRTIVGENVWHRWLEVYGNDQTKPVVTLPKVRNFKFGGGETLQSSYEVEFTAVVHGQVLPLTASIVPGNTPFLLARPTLEKGSETQLQGQPHEDKGFHQRFNAPKIMELFSISMVSGSMPITSGSSIWK